MRQKPGLIRALLLPEEGWLSLGCVLSIALSTIWSVEAADWVNNLDVLPWIAATAIGSAFVAAKSRVPVPIGQILGILLGIATVAYAIAVTLPADGFVSKIILLWDRLQLWLAVTVSGGVSTDNLLFLLLLGAIAWLMAYYGTWSVFRSRGPWWIILSSGTALVVNVSYSRGLDVYVPLYLFAAILLVVRLNIAVLQTTWRKNGVEFSSEFSGQLLRNSTMVGVAVVLATWFIPSGSVSDMLTEAWGNVSGPWQQAESQFSRLFGGLRVQDRAAVSGFGKTLPLRGTTTLGTTEVLEVSDSKARYLRGVVYERYTGQGWTAPERPTEQLAPNDGRMAVVGNLMLREEVTATLKVLQDRGLTVLAPAQPLRVSLTVGAEFEVAGSTEQDGSADAHSDVSTMRSVGMLRRGQEYAAVASVSRADVKSLRSAGREYPEWVQHYLSLPKTIPARVISLARRITRQNDTAYDTAIAIQGYLRSYPYSDNVPAAPPGRDTVDFFLFGARVGYCDYYASAMVVMLRIVGIPARVVSGYAPGEYDANRQAYIVRDDNAHSWPEVYFPNYGWIEFEPTASRPAPIRPIEQLEAPVTSESAATTSPDPALSTEEEEPDPRDVPANPPMNFDEVNPLVALREQYLPFTGGALVVLLILWLLRRRAYRGMSVAESAYRKMEWLTKWIGLERRLHETPHEHGRRIAALVPAQQSDVETIVEGFMRHRFGRKADEPDKSAVAKAWSRLRWALLRGLHRGRRHG